jgi:hypothetical protein
MCKPNSVFVWILRKTFAGHCDWFFLVLHSRSPASLTQHQLELLQSLQSSMVCLASALSTLINPLNAKLNPICHLLALLGARHILHVSGLRVKRHGHDVTGLIMLGYLTQVNLPFKFGWFLYLPPYLISIDCILHIVRQAYAQ